MTTDAAHFRLASDDAAGLRSLRLRRRHPRRHCGLPHGGFLPGGSGARLDPMTTLRVINQAALSSQPLALSP